MKITKTEGNNIICQYDNSDERNTDITTKCTSGYTCTKIYGGLNGEPLTAEFRKN